MDLTRRQFMVGCSAAIAAMAGGRIGNLVFAAEAETAATSDEMLMVVFLRGGCDGLSLVAPFDDPVYVAERGSIALPSSGVSRAIAIDARNASFTGAIGLHPKAGALKELYDARKLAIVHACGLENDTRSHFEAMDYMERGGPGSLGAATTSTGWLTRHLAVTPTAGLLPSVAASSSLPASLLGDGNSVSMSSLGGFSLDTHWRYNDAGLPFNMLAAAKKLYSGTSAVEQAGKRTVEVIETLQSRNLSYTPEPGVAYPSGSFGASLKLVAQAIKQDMGLRVSTVDYGGWDTHERQGNAGGGYFASQVDTLARGLHAFLDDLPNHQERLTVVVMSEFGRRLGVNSSEGTDHGHGNVMLVLGGNVNGGQIYGRWPGLEDLDQNQDLRITTDYRTILSEILVRRLTNPRLGIVFPEYKSYAPLGIVRGQDLLPIYATAPQGTTHKVFVPMVSR